MPGTVEKDILELGLGLNVAKANSALQDFQKQGVRATKAISQGMRAVGTGISKFALTGLNKTSIGLGKMTSGIAKVTNAYKEYGNIHKKFDAHIALNQQNMLTASKEEGEAIEANIAKLKQLKSEAVKAHKATYGHAYEALGDVKKVGKSGKETLLGNSEKGTKGIFQAGAAILRKDFEGGIEHAATALGTGFASAAVVKKWTDRAGKGFWSTAKDRWTKAKEANSAGGSFIGGKAMAAGHTAVAALSAAGGAASGAMGGILKTLSSMGPLLTVAAAGMAAIVKLMIDAEAGAKEMNKKILETSGSSYMFYKHTQNGNAALADMNEMLGDIRKSANSLQNVKWGINKEDHEAVLNALTAEGVQLDNIRNQFKSTGDEATDAEGRAAKFGDAVHVAVAYSRQFGVSIQEVASMQGTLMSTLGESVDEVGKTYHSMALDAANSGIASNKFFSIIRDVSSDLNLYNTRIEDAAHFLGILGKVMSPKNAAEFLKSSSGAIAQMGRAERTKFNVLGKGVGQQYVERDIKFKTEDLSKKMSTLLDPEAVDKLASALNPKAFAALTGDDTKKTADARDLVAKAMENSIANGTEDFLEAINELPQALQGSMKEAFYNLKTKKELHGSKDQVAQGISIGEVGMAAQVDIVEKTFKQFGGFTSTASQMLQEQFNIDFKKSQEYHNLALQMEDEKKILKKGLKDNKVLERLQAAGIKVTGDNAESQKAVDEAGYDQIVRAQGETSGDAAKAVKTELDYAKETSQFTSTIGQKLEAIFNWLTDQLWNVMNDVLGVMNDMWTGIQGIWSWLKSLRILGGSGTEDKSYLNGNELKKAQMAANRTKNTDLSSAAYSTDTMEGLRTAVEKVGAKQIDAIYNGTDQQRKNYADNIQNTVAPKDLDNLLSKILPAVLGTTGEGRARTGEISKGVAGGKSFADMMKAAGLNAKEQGDIMKTLSDALDETKLIQLTNKSSRNVAKTVSAAPIPEAEAATSTNPPTAEALTSPVPVAPTSPTIPATVSPAHAAALATTQAATVSASDQGEAIVSSLDGLDDALTKNGIKLNRNFLRSQFWKDGHDAVLDATRESLLEYFLYSKMDPNSVAAGLKNGDFNKDTVGQKALQAATSLGKVAMNTQDIVSATQSQRTTGGIEAPVPGFAQGGIVPTPKSPDSVFVAAKPGERILPKDNNGSQINITIPITGVAGAAELGRMVKAAAMTTILEWSRRSKTT